MCMSTEEFQEINALYSQSIQQGAERKKDTFVHDQKETRCFCFEEKLT